MRLTQLWTYPLKSGRAVGHASANVERRGLVGDRRFMLVDPKGHFLSQRQLATLAKLTLSFDGETVEVGFDQSHTRARFCRDERQGQVSVEIWQDEVMATPIDRDLDAWISRRIGSDAQLVYMGEAVRRPVDPDYRHSADDHVSFADGFPLLIASEASLSELNRRLRQGDEPEVPMDRFRPNLVLDGEVPFAEDGWKEIQIGALRAALVKPCSRCVMVTTDQDTAERRVEPLRTLSQFRKAGSDVLFGVNAIPLNEATVRIGDDVSIRSLAT